MPSLLPRLLPVVAVVLLAALRPPMPVSGQDVSSVVYLVRHAEKLDDSADPPLTTRGEQRAALLARTLEDAGVTRVLSSDYDRTRSTVAPLASQLGLDVEIYDPGNLSNLADRIRATPGRFLVSGHSNTTPALVALLGGEPGQPIREADEYDRLYVVVLGAQGTSTILLRYGPAVP